MHQAESPNAGQARHLRWLRSAGRLRPAREPVVHRDRGA